MSRDSRVSKHRCCCWLRATIAVELLLALVPASQLAAAPPTWEVIAVQPGPAWRAAFHQTEGWTGADVAYSIPLGSEKTLWIFADTFIGRVESGRRESTRMINNSFAWQSLKNHQAPWQFFWKGSLAEPAAILQPTEKDQWYWPGDGALVNNQLYLLAKLVRKKKGGAPGFEFDWCGNHLLEISNPNDEPSRWKFQVHALPTGPDEPQLSAACLVESGHLYLYGLFPAKDLHGLHRPLALARIALAELPPRNELQLEYLGENENGRKWSPKPSKLLELFGDAAPEMTVHRMQGRPEFVATYTSLGLGGEIMARFAPTPEGPWSDPLRVYHCPEAERGWLVYGAKSHPELAARNDELIITYCVNTGSLTEHMARPDIYIPRVLSVRLGACAPQER